MSDAYWDAFFQLHRDLPREGPGLAEDVAWATEVANLTRDARICDAACGPGADIPALKTAAPEGTIRALDKVPHFVAQARAAYGDLPGVDLTEGDMATLTGPYDFIWCAGAIYFLGVTEALKTWRAALAPRGTVAFSQVCWFTDTPSEAARAGWADYADMTDEAGVLARIDAAGYECLATRRLSDAAWEAYYGPLDERISALSPGDTPQMRQVLEEARAEAALWRKERAAFGYLLCVVRPK
ncbi:MAG: class I SAM-dependent methyltransferase [Pseudomonadota bacterium]